MAVTSMDFLLSTLIDRGLWKLMILSLLLVSILCYALLCTYRITFHPLAKFPGPKIAAINRWYETYCEVFKDGTGGKFTDQIVEWHQLYGPIVRINPFELHVDDPDYYDVLFNMNPHLWKRTFAIDNLVHTASSSIHKMRRQVLQNYFSTQSTTNMTHIIRERLDALCEHYAAAQGTGKPVRVSLMNRALSTDIICEYAFGKSWHFIEQPEYSLGYFTAVQQTFRNIFLFRESKIVNWLALCFILLPDWFFSKGNVKVWTEWAEKVRQHTHAAMSHEKRNTGKDNGKSTIFEEYKNNKLPAAEKTPNRIFQTALMILGAGSGTPSYVLDTAIFHVLANEDIHTRLRAEVAQIWPDPTSKAPEVSVLENAPFLRAVVKESLRLALGPMARLQRVNPFEDMRFHEWTIPRGTPIGMTHKLIHYNEDIFPEPWRFNPDRWLQGDDSKRLEKYLVTFSRGSRQCLAIPLAYSEMYLTLATLFRRFDLQLHNCNRACVDPKYDYFAPFPENDDLDKGRVQALVK